MKQFSYILIALILVCSLVIALTYQQSNREIIQQIHRIESTIIHKDSLLHTTQTMVQAQEEIIRQQDSIIVDQRNMIDNYGKAVDSLSYLMRYFERSNLRERYRSNEPGRRPD